MGILDEDVVRRTLRDESVAGIIHIAAKKQVGESVEQPLLYYRETRDGQLLEEGISEAGALSSWIAAATSYSVHGFAMLPVGHRQDTRGAAHWH